MVEMFKGMARHVATVRAETAFPCVEGATAVLRVPGQTLVPVALLAVPDLGAVRDVFLSDVPG